MVKIGLVVLSLVFFYAPTFAQTPPPKQEDVCAGESGAA